MYFDAMSKIGENAAVSPVSRELGEFPRCPVLWLFAASSRGNVTVEIHPAFTCWYQKHLSFVYSGGFIHYYVLEHFLLYPLNKCC